MKVYGPYFNKEGRQHVIIIYQDGSRKTKPYPRYIVEQYIGRELDSELETVDHIDKNFMNNDLSNLRIIPRSEHVKQDSVRLKKILLVCLWCNKEFERNANHHANNKRKGKDGPFCDRSCGAKYGHEKQLGRLSWGNNYTDNREYYILKDDMDIKSNLDDYKVN